MIAPVPTQHIEAAIRSLEALKGHDRFSFQMLAVARNLDAIFGNDMFAETILDLESELGLDDSECLVCSSDCGGACDNALTYVERISPTSIAA